MHRGASAVAPVYLIEIAIGHLGLQQDGLAVVLRRTETWIEVEVIVQIRAGKAAQHVDLLKTN